MNPIKKVALYSALIGSLAFGGNALVQEGGLEGKLQGGNQPRQEQVQNESQKEVVVHSSGSRWSWEALSNGDYTPRSNEIFNELETNTSSNVSGGFNREPKIFSQLGTYINQIPEKQINTLVEKFKNRIDKNDRLLTALQSLLKDNSSYIIIEQFLNDGGRIEAWSHSGRYTPNPLVLAVGIDGSNFDVEATLYHESLHYAFDKMNSILSESPDTGGADHCVISPLEDRLRIIQQIRNKQVPLFDENNSGLYGFTTDGKIGDKIKNYIDNNDLNGLESYINSENFQRGYVRSSMTMPLSSNDYYDQHPEDRERKYRLTDGQIIDIAFLNAINGAIIQQSVNIGISIANRNSIRITKSFETAEFQNEFQKFLSQYTKRLENPNAQPYGGTKIK